MVLIFPEERHRRLRWQELYIKMHRWLYLMSLRQRLIQSRSLRYIIEWMIWLAIKLLYSFHIDYLLADFVRILQYFMRANWFSAVAMMRWWMTNPECITNSGTLRHNTMEQKINNREKMQNILFILISGNIKFLNCFKSACAGKKNGHGYKVQAVKPADKEHPWKYQPVADAIMEIGRASCRERV